MAQKPNFFQVPVWSVRKSYIAVGEVWGCRQARRLACEGCEFRNLGVRSHAGGRYGGVAHVPAPHPGIFLKVLSLGGFNPSG